LSPTTGKTAEAALGKAGVTVNKNLIPFDQRKPMDPSGIRMGTAALTTRGMDESAIRQVAGYIVEALKTPDDDAHLAKVAAAVAEMLKSYPVPADAV